MILPKSSVRLYAPPSQTNYLGQRRITGPRGYTLIYRGIHLSAIATRYTHRHTGGCRPTMVHGQSGRDSLNQTTRFRSVLGKKLEQRWGISFRWPAKLP